MLQAVMHILYLCRLHALFMLCSGICKVNEYWIKSSVPLFMSGDILDRAGACVIPRLAYRNIQQNHPKILDVFTLS